LPSILYISLFVFSGKKRDGILLELKEAEVCDILSRLKICIQSYTPKR